MSRLDRRYRALDSERTTDIGRLRPGSVLYLLCILGPVAYISGLSADLPG